MSGTGERETIQSVEDDLVVVARAVKTRGLRGEIVAELLTDFPERFDDLKQLIAVNPSGVRRNIKLESHWFQKNRIILKFEGFDSIEAATPLLDYEFAVPEAESVELDEDEFYNWQLVGCRVETIEGEEIGRVREILPTGGAPLLVVDGSHEREHLIPLAKAICVEIDIKRKLIRTDAPEGLLEL